MGMGLGTTSLRSTSHHLLNLKSPRIILALAFSLSIPVSAVFALAPQSNVDSPKTVFLDVDNWIGGRCPLLDYLEETSAEHISKGNFRLLLVDRTCVRCQTLLGQYQSTPINSLSKNSRALIIDLSTTSDARPPIESIQELRLHGAARYVAQVPIEIFIIDGVVASVEHR